MRSSLSEHGCEGGDVLHGGGGGGCAGRGRHGDGGRCAAAARDAYRAGDERLDIFEQLRIGVDSYVGIEVADAHLAPDGGLGEQQFMSAKEARLKDTCSYETFDDALFRLSIFASGK